MAAQKALVGAAGNSAMIIEQEPTPVSPPQVSHRQVQRNPSVLALLQDSPEALQ